LHFLLLHRLHLSGYSGRSIIHPRFQKPLSVAPQRHKARRWLRVFRRDPLGAPQRVKFVFFFLISQFLVPQSDLAVDLKFLNFILPSCVFLVALPLNILKLRRD
jgi:hypothetical protein